MVQGYLNYHSVPGQLSHDAEVQDIRNRPLATGAEAQEPAG
uniref:Retron-type RNA-directed DNA polymerase n=1 Tax=Klebsiella pneumoniae TaxID=573 RepID=A0A8B0SX43_KLEPN|nr:Retron-type RNA-directed DNA polymerase [Klebsiella pneumoniae]